MELDAVTRPSVVLCPPLTSTGQRPTWVARLAQALRESAVPVLVPDPPAGHEAPTAPSAPGGPPDPAADRMSIAGWVADQAVAITAAGWDRRLLLVAHGAATRGLPALGMSQRAARHGVVGYVLVDGPLPAPGRSGQDWPDAPALVVHSRADDDADRLAALRGWRTATGSPHEVILSHVRAWPDGV
jgi:hypothetical protein